MSIPITRGKARLATISALNDDGSVNTDTLTPAAPSPTIKAAINPSNPREIGVLGVSTNSSGANVSVTGAAGTSASQVFTVTAPTGLASTSFGPWSDEVDPPAWLVNA